MISRKCFEVLAFGLALGVGSRQASAQAPTIGTELPQQLGGTPGSTGSMLGPIPGAGGGNFASPAVGAGQILGGRAGTSSPRVPTSLSNPGAVSGLAPPSVPALPAAPLLTQVPLYGTLELPVEADEGPADGLTIDQAINLLIRDNPDLKARAYEIPSAQADVLTASLRGNPIFYADSQLIPYGSYSNNRQGGPAQYDINVSQPVDYAGKRRARIASALQAKKAIELQYQDAVRIQIGNMSGAYVSVLAARETLRYAEAGLAGLERLLDATKKLKKAGTRNLSDVAMLEAQRATAEAGVLDAREGLRKAKLALGGYFNMPPEQAETLELRDTLRDVAPPPPPVDQLYAMALTCRPDVRAYVVGIEVAKYSLRLQQANRFADAYVLYQPYTSQNLSYLGHATSATSWAIGVTVPLPVFNRNQGNIERAKINIDQSIEQLVAVKRQAIEQVRDAQSEYEATKAILERFEQTILPNARQALDSAKKLFLAGENPDVTSFLNTQREYNTMIRQYRDTTVRHRRSMLILNTVVGSQILP